MDHLRYWYTLQTFIRHILLDTFWEVVAEWLENEEDNPSILVPPFIPQLGVHPYVSVNGYVTARTGLAIK